MIEFSSNSNNRSSGDPENDREALQLISLLLVFAIAASSYVMYMSLQAPKDMQRTRYQLLIRCIIIVTSVVPSDLPMQLAIAVNASLMQLMKQGVFCTEPFRVPMSGRIDCIFFDKTGTVTTDQLEAVGIIPSNGKGELVSLKKAPLDACRVLSGCHSLLELEDRLQGDPIETAAIAAIGWDYSQDSGCAYPSVGPRKKKEDENKVVTSVSKKRDEERALKQKEMANAWAKERPFGETPQKVRIIHRYHFQSKLQVLYIC